MTSWRRILGGLRRWQKEEIIVEMERRLLGLTAVGNETGQQMHEEIVGTTVARVLDLTHILELIMDGFDERTLAPQQLIGKVLEPIAHIRAQLGDEAQPLSEEEVLSKWR